MLHIFSTSRQIREFYNSFDDGILPKAISMGEFEKRAVYVVDKKEANEDMRAILLRQACAFENFKKLRIPHEFLAFLSCSSYIFRFFEELSLEKKEIDDLIHVDTYAQFDDHLEVLKTLKDNYTTLLDKHKLYDNITLPSIYKINDEYIQSFHEITLHVQGLLNAYEWELIEKISSLTKLTIRLNINPYNHKILELFSKRGISLPKNADVCINMSENSYTTLQKPSHQSHITYKNFSLRSLQVGYIYERVEHFLSLGLEPEEIVVILPDEDFTRILKTYDRSKNFNFAMGFSFLHTTAYKRLDAIAKFIKERSPKNEALVKRLGCDQSAQELKNIWSSVVSYKEFVASIKKIDLLLKTAQKAIFENELYQLKAIFSHIQLTFFEAYKLFLNRLAKAKIDDVSGGRVSVMGVLETRGLGFKGVIIPDFNDEFIPHFNEKDMFLSSSLRLHAKLPTHKDRENLQRYYYHNLITSASYVAIAYVENETHVSSRFLSSFDAKKDDLYHEESYATILFDAKKMRDIDIPKELIRENSIFQTPLSSSRLKNFLTCKRGYYIKYILGIQEEEIPSNQLKPNDVGSFLHGVLKELYEKNPSYQDPNALHSDICSLLDKTHHKSPIWEIQREFWKRELMPFCQNEIEHFQNGWRVFGCERKLGGKIGGVEIFGIVDRIDVNQNGEFCVIDYKSGNIKVAKSDKELENMSDFQLQFYFLLAQNAFKNVQKAGYYDLQRGKILWDDELMDEKILLLKKILEDIRVQKSIDFALEEKDCQYSPYKILLGKE